MKVEGLTGVNSCTRAETKDGFKVLIYSLTSSLELKGAGLGGSRVK